LVGKEKRWLVFLGSGRQEVKFDEMGELPIDAF
jgi:hypothetical protein